MKRRLISGIIITLVIFLFAVTGIIKFNAQKVVEDTKRGFMKSTITKQKEPIPQKVIEFAQLQEGGELHYHGEWHGYKAYLLSYPKVETGDWGLPTYILYDGQECKFADVDDVFTIMDEAR